MGVTNGESLVDSREEYCGAKYPQIIELLAMSTRDMLQPSNDLNDLLTLVGERGHGVASSNRIFCAANV